MAPVTSVQLAPASRVTCTRPSFDPAQITPRSTGDSAMAKSTEAYVGLTSSVVSPPVFCILETSLRVRSGLITSQLCPPSVVRWTCWLPA